MPWLINATQLDSFRKNQKNVIIFDASWHLPDEGRDGYQEFLQDHILGAQFFDIHLVNDKADPNKLLLDTNFINQKLSTLGIRSDYKLIFYDDSHLRTACYAVWLMKLLGHPPQQLYVLNGGYATWKREGGKTASGEVNPTSRAYECTLQPQYLTTLSQMKENLTHPHSQVIDTRHPVRFSGGSEALPHVRSGHIPGSFCFPYFTLFEKEGQFLSLDKIKKRMSEIGIDLMSPMISLGSPITAAILDFTLDLMSHINHQVYYGSWIEWGNTQLYPGEISINERPVTTCLV